MSKKESDFSVYNVSILNLFGIQEEFKHMHIPFLTYKDVYGALAIEGTSGTGKTTLFQRIAVLNELATGGKYGIYSADKARYEDFVGCPIPNEEKKKMDMYPIEHALATKEMVLVNEINRADYGNQEKWLSLLSSRVIDGFNTECRYIYADMNPIMCEQDNEVYEGVQPLDKALGERMSGLITMKNFNKLTKKDQVDVMKSSFNQSEWKPTEKAVELHRRFIEEARSFYEYYKEEITSKLCDYLCSIQKVFKEERKEHGGSALIEARRAQYMLTNILALHSINSVIHGDTYELEHSAMEGLSISFPNRLWEQPIPLPALKQAHNESVSHLKDGFKPRVKVEGSFDVIDNLRRHYEESKTDKETISKVVHNGLPNKKTNPIDHYLYSISVVKAIESFGENLLLKEQEYSRIKAIVTEIEEDSVFNIVKDIGIKYKEKGTFPKKTALPEYIEQDISDTGIEAYKEAIKTELGWYVSTILEKVNKDLLIRDGLDYQKLIEKYIISKELFINFMEKLKDNKIEWIDKDEDWEV